MIMNNSENFLRYKNEISINNTNDPRVLEINYISPNSCVLDVGCACGDFGIALKKYKDCIIYGFEYDIKSIEIAKNSNAYKDITQLDINLLSTEDFQNYKNKFDYIVCGDVLEHLNNPLSILDILKTYLKPTGSIIASIPNIAHSSIKANLLCDDFTYTNIGLLDKTHIRFFTYKTIYKELSKRHWLILKCNFTYIDINGWQPNNPFPLLNTDVKYEIFSDWHSFVCQYVIQMIPSNKNIDFLLKHNSDKVSINNTNAPQNIIKRRSDVLSNIISHQISIKKSIERCIRHKKRYKIAVIIESIIIVFAIYTIIY